MNARIIVCIALLLAAGIAGPTAWLHAGEAAGTQASGPLSMEELEVRGAREKPDLLFLPPVKPVFHAAPVHLGIFTEDLAMPFYPREEGDEE